MSDVHYSSYLQMTLILCLTPTHVRISIHQRRNGNNKKKIKKDMKIIEVF